MSVAEVVQATLALEAAKTNEVENTSINAVNNAINVFAILL